MANRTKTIAGSGAALAAAIALIAPFVMKQEGDVHHPYKDVVGVLTVCYGHTGPDIVVKTYTETECRAIAEADLTKIGDGVLAATPSLATRPNQLAAAISFSYNVGVQTYAKSSVARQFNAGNYMAGCTAMLPYDMAGGKFYQALANRRHQEYLICMKGLPDVGATTRPSP